jgi:hypothetical protein
LTLVELIVVMLVMSIVMTLSTLLIINVNQQTSNMLDTVQGVEQATEANLTLVQYLRGASQLLAVYNSAGTQIGPSATELDVVANEGFNTGVSTNNYGVRNSYQSNCTNIDAMWYVPSSPVNADAQFAVTFDAPGSGPPNSSPWTTARVPPGLTPQNGAGPYSFNPASPCSPTVGFRTVSTYYADSAQSLVSDPVFTYWAWSTTAASTTTTSVASSNIPPGLIQLPLTSGGSPGAPNVLPACSLTEVAAIGVHVTFLAGPQRPREGYAADEPTTVNTLIFLRGSSTSGATTTTSSTTTTTTIACHE